jgi:predicted RNA binding protein YcfA (HicA-like mRNA interferase family)
MPPQITYSSLLLEPLAQFEGEESFSRLLRIGWREDIRISEGSHRQLIREGFERFTWAFHDGEEIGPKMLARIAKKTGLRPEDL